MFPRGGATRGATVQGLMGVAAALIVWEGVARLELISANNFPTMSATLGAVAEEATTGAYWENIWHTLQGWAIGLAIAMAIAVPLGLLIGLNELVYRGLRPIIEFLRPVPSVALIPLAVLVYGTGLTSKVFLVGFGATWPLLIQTMYGVRDVDPLQVETARSFQIGRARRTLRVTLPSTVPYIVTGLRISSSTALILAVTAELIIGARGVGSAIVLAQSGGAVDLMYALIITTGLIGLVLNAAFSRAERRILRWHPAHREGIA